MALGTFPWMMAIVFVALVILGIYMIAFLKRRKGKLEPEHKVSLIIGAVVVIAVAVFLLFFELVIYPSGEEVDGSSYFPIWLVIWIVIFLPLLTRKQKKLTKKEQERQQKLVLIGVTLLAVAALAGVVALFLF